MLRTVVILLGGTMRHRLIAAVSSLVVALAGLAALDLAGAPSATAATQIIPVPTQAAGLDRIVTAPNGTIWFVERDANKVGRIVDGQVTEIPLPAEFDSSKVEDIDVAPDSSVWVIYETGEWARHLAPDGTTISDVHIGATDGAPGGGYPYGESVRVAPDGTAWFTMSFDEQFVTVANDSGFADLPNAPECLDALGRAHDGAMWCRTSSGLTHIGAGGGGVTYPANNYAAYPYAIAPGPVGSIWFGRYVSGTFITSPSKGEVGYLDAASGRITAFDTGSRTAPSDLVQGPDGTIWFTSIGAAKGIGHIGANGRGGALTQIGGYEPRSLTFGTDGALYATDAANNVIIRTTIDQLQVTNVDPGDGSVLLGGAGGKNVGRIKVGKQPVKVKDNVVGLRLVCPKDATGKCAGKARLTTNAKKNPKVVSAKLGYKVKAGKSGQLKLRLTAKGLKAVRQGKVTKLRIELYAKGAEKPSVVKVIKVVKAKR